MQSLAQQRAAIASGMAGSRAASGAAERAATGSALIAERRGAEMVEDLNRLAKPVTQRRTLRTIQPRGALPPAKGRAVYQAPESTGGGVASPLTEGDYTVREWWPDGIPSTDGLLMLPAQKVIAMTDANGAPVVFNYAEPV